MKFIQKQHVLVKLVLYLIMVFLVGFILSIFSGFVIPTQDTISDWQFSVSFILAFIITAAAAVLSEHNVLQKQREKALATQNDLYSIEQRTENTLFQLESLMMGHMEHENEVYLTISKNETKHFPKKLRTMTQVRDSLAHYPALRSDETVMRLFSEITNSYDMLMNCKIAYNSLAAEYNSGIHKFPANLFQNTWGFTELSYFNVKEDSLIRDDEE